MQKYLILTIIFLAMLCYIGYLKYDNKILENQIIDLKASNKQYQLDLNIQKSIAAIIENKNEEMIKNIKELEQKAIILDTKQVDVKNCKVEVSSLDTNKTTARGVPLFLGNIGR